MVHVFVSYRRDDSAGHAGRLADALEQRFGADSVFRDVDDIVPGEDFARVIDARLAQVDWVLVLIGPRWLDADSSGLRRLDRADDFVRREIESALAAGKPVVPVLVGGAQMPEATLLPASIRALASRQEVDLRDASWRADLASLAQVLQGENRSAAGSANAWGLAALSARVARMGRHGLRLGLGLGVVVLLAVLLAWLALRSGVDGGQDGIAGEWSGQVEYPWGVNQLERFRFSVDGTRLGGTAGFLGVPRAIESGRLENGSLRFMTRSTARLGASDVSELEHHYWGTVDGPLIHFRMQSGSVSTGVAEIEFTVGRAGPDAPTGGGESKP
ncbi:toll/interleukin-1 receptor domain-containing protein [Azoarcus sp. L1K30]|nr:toll/interleukin-1 receptor domain-containing protein [Azoarcus sp. L1K30]